LEVSRPKTQSTEDVGERHLTIITNLIHKKCSLQKRMYDLRYDDSREDEDKEMDLKGLADEINEIESKIIEQVKSSTNSFIGSLELPAKVDNIFGDRKKVPPLKSFLSTGSVGTSSPFASPRHSSSGSRSGSAPADEAPFHRPPSTLTPAASTRRRSRLTHLFQSLPELREKDKEIQSDLDLVEQEIAGLRATLMSESEAKRAILTKTQQRRIDDVREQLKLKVSQKEKLVRERYKLKEQKDTEDQ